jgi:hypothetical protein
MMPRMKSRHRFAATSEVGLRLDRVQRLQPDHQRERSAKGRQIAQHPARDRDDAEHHRGRRAGFLGLDPHRVRWNRNLGGVVRGHCWETCRRNGVGSGGWVMVSPRFGESSVRMAQRCSVGSGHAGTVVRSL